MKKWGKKKQTDPACEGTSAVPVAEEVARESSLQKVKTNLPNIITCGSFGFTFEKSLHHSFIAFEITLPSYPMLGFAEVCSFPWDLERKEVLSLHPVQFLKAPGSPPSSCPEGGQAGTAIKLHSSPLQSHTPSTSHALTAFTTSQV